METLTGVPKGQPDQPSRSIHRPNRRMRPPDRASNPEMNQGARRVITSAYNGLFDSFQISSLAFYVLSSEPENPGHDCADGLTFTCIPETKRRPISGRPFFLCLILSDFG